MQRYVVRPFWRGTGLRSVHKPQKVVAIRSEKQVEQMTSAEHVLW